MLIIIINRLSGRGWWPQEGNTGFPPPPEGGPTGSAAPAFGVPAVDAAPIADDAALPAYVASAPAYVPDTKAPPAAPYVWGLTPAEGKFGGAPTKAGPKELAAAAPKLLPSTALPVVSVAAPMPTEAVPTKAGPKELAAAAPKLLPSAASPVVLVAAHMPTEAAPTKEGGPPVKAAPKIPVSWGPCFKTGPNDNRVLPFGCVWKTWSAPTKYRGPKELAAAAPPNAAAAAPQPKGHMLIAIIYLQGSRI